MAHVSFCWRSIMDIGLTIRALNYQFRGPRFDTTRWLHGHSTFHHFADGQMSTSNSWGLVIQINVSLRSGSTALRPVKAI